MPAIDVDGPSGRLEALLEGGDAPRFAALVCHPHPGLGGTLHNHATYRLARAARATGGLSLRFNFRGVGRSAGAFDHGRGEAADAAAALAWLAAAYPALPRLACGFSFGAFAALAAGPRDPGVTGLLLAGVVTTPREDLPERDLGPLRTLALPVAVVQAAGDLLGAPGEVARALEGAAGPRRLAVVPGASHLFTEALDGLEAAAIEAYRWLHPT
jgi:uncharacterized protein